MNTHGAHNNSLTSILHLSAKTGIQVKAAEYLVAVLKRHTEQEHTSRETSTSLIKADLKLAQNLRNPSHNVVVKCSTPLPVTAALKGTRIMVVSSSYFRSQQKNTFKRDVHTT